MRKKNTSSPQKSSAANSGKPSFGKPTQSKPKKFGGYQKKKVSSSVSEANKDSIRLNKYLADGGICSRREADELIKLGLVEVNGKIIKEMGYQVQKEDVVKYDGNQIFAEKPVYVVLNKPKGFITTTKDEKARKTVMDLVQNASPYRIYPVGRLDRQTTGVLLFTNDGHMAKKLTHPSHGVKKIYHVTLDKRISGETLMDILNNGVHLEEGLAKVDQLSFIEGESNRSVGIEIHIGWNRVVRRIFKAKGFEVEKLDRVYFGGLTKKNLKRGQWKILTEQEINFLKMV
ncbi:MAG: rRNA pseudouridine synthase [Flavobacteriaceae bacterium]|nr:MAG: rRNA pseudouridine synthase [Flavobacteriaceae bacterium]